MFEVYLHPKADKALNDLSDEEYLQCAAGLSLLAVNPYPGSGGDKEKLRGYKNRYRIHIGRSYSAMYQIEKEKKEVTIISFGTIGDIHKKY